RRFDLGRGRRTETKLAKWKILFGEPLLLGVHFLSERLVLLLLQPANVEIERDQFLALAQLEAIDVFAEVDEFVELRLTLKARIPQRIQNLGLQRGTVEETGGDLVPHKGAFETAFTNRQKLVNGGKHYIGHDAFQLGG